MRRLMTVLGVALLGYAVVPASAQAQFIYVPSYRTYSAPVFVPQPVQSYYYAPSVATYSAPASYSYYPSTYYSSSYSAPASYSYYPSTTSYYSSSYAAPSVATYSAPASYYYPSTTSYYSSYSAPAAVVPAAGVYTTDTYYGYGIFRPRGYYNQSYYTPLR